MDERIISLDQPDDSSKRRFWSLRVRKKTDDIESTLGNTENSKCNTITSSSSSKNKKNYKNGMGDTSTGSMKEKEKKKSRLSMFKSWLLTLVRSKSKSNLKSGIDDTKFVDPNLLQSISKTSIELFEQATGKIGLTITLPPGVTGKHIKVNVEIKVFPQGEIDEASEDEGLCLVKSLKNGAVYSGNIKVPSMVSMIQLAEMSLYFLNGGSDSRRVETIIKPIENILPDKYDYNALVKDIHLNVHFETRVKFSKPTLDYEFVTDVMPIVKYHVHEDTRTSTDRSSLVSFRVVDSSLMSLRTEDFIEHITDETDGCYDESSKTIVKEILNQVVSKLSCKSSNDLIEDFHKELEIQKVLLLDTASSILPNSDSLLSKISETEHEEEEASSSAGRSASKTSKSSSKNWSEATKSSQLSITNWKMASDTGSDSKLKVPSNTPDAFIPVGSKRKHKKKAVREEARTDMDKTLHLLETAKDKLIEYLNQELPSDGREFTTTSRGTVMDYEECVESAGKVKIDPFKNFDRSDYRRIDYKLEKKKKKAKYMTIRELLRDPSYISHSSEKRAQRPSNRKISFGPRNSPVNEIKNLIFDEIEKQTGVRPPDDAENYGLEYLANTCVCLDNKVVERVTDQYLSLELISAMEENYVESLNTEVFDERYEFDCKTNYASKDRIEDDIDIILQELMAQTEAVKDIVVAHEKKMNDASIEDVWDVLEELLQKVEDQVEVESVEPPMVETAMTLYKPMSLVINPVYFCLIDDYVDVYPSVTRVAFGNPMNWLSQRLRTTAVTEKKSTVSVKRCLSSIHMCYECAENDGLLDKLEKGTVYLSELYREIYSRPLNGHVGRKPHNPFAMEKIKGLPVVRKSNKIGTDFTKAVEKAGTSAKEKQESAMEKVEKVINPDKETEKLSKMEAFDDVNLKKWPSWKREWLTLFSKQHDPNEQEGFRQLSELIKVVEPAPSVQAIDCLPGPNAGQTASANPKAFRKSFRMKPPFNVNQKEPNTISFVALTMNSKPNPELDKSESVSERLRQLHFENSSRESNDRNETKPKISEKKTFKRIGNPAKPHDMSMPGTSKSSDDSMVLLHEGRSPSSARSPPRDLFGSDTDSSVKHYVPPVADIPRGFGSSSVEAAYFNNVAVLQDRMLADNVSIYSSSSSEDGTYQRRADSLPKPRVNNSTASMVTHTDDYYTPLPSNSSDDSVWSGALSSKTADYFADEDYPTSQAILPDLKHEYISQPELNPPDEVARIEENIMKNERLNPQIKSLSTTVIEPYSIASSSVSLSYSSSSSLQTTDVNLQPER